MTYKCEIKETPEQPALSIRTRTGVQGLPQAIGEGFGKIFDYLGRIGEQCAGAPYVAYYNMDMADLDVEIGVPTDKKLSGNDEIKPGRLPGGPMGTCFYTGPYAEMPAAYEALHKLLAEKGLVPTGIAYEVYYNSPMDTEPSKLQTLIMFPLKQ